MRKNIHKKEELDEVDFVPSKIRSFLNKKITHICGEKKLLQDETEVVFASTIEFEKTLKEQSLLSKRWRKFCERVLEYANDHVNRIESMNFEI